MHLSLASAATLFSYCIICFFCHHLIIASAINAPASDSLEDVAINCGSRSNSASIDGREWIAEAQGLKPKGKSTSSRITKHGSFCADPIPYMTARISATQFSYTFQVNPGQKFVRLHFYPSSYPGFEKSLDFFNVEAGPFTLLKNFSASLTSDALRVNYLVKEFCLNVEENNNSLHITFSTYQSSKQRETYAFVNGIEIISMPTSLYYTPDGDSGAPIVGQENRFYPIDNGSALEMVQRLNIGGSSISPIEDFGMFRRWSGDVNYLLTPKLQSVNYLVRGIKFTSIPAFTAPLKIYQTSWKTGKSGRADKMHDFTWKIPVDVGFAYLVRLHFCDFELEMTGGSHMPFSVLINNQIAGNKVDIISLSGGFGVPIYRDYVAMVKGGKDAGTGDLLIALQSPDELVIGLLHGLEILKLSGLGDNLGSSIPLSLEQVSTNWNIAFGKKNAIMTCMTMLIILLNVIVFKLREIWEEISHDDKVTLPDSRGQSFRRFKLQEIKSATQNFSSELFIGKGGFGEVYKGFIGGSSEIVAVKRLKSNSKQGAREFWAEIETLSKIRHVHLVSLIGYCNECREMILVYEYMPRGTLADNLYKIGRNGKDGTPLTWEQRLRICIGAARGLDYLHTGIEYGVIHRDVKDSNILLDQNLVAKISDFGLSKQGRLSESQSDVSTKVKGTFGYLDPEYIRTHKPTRKTDVYAFGVVLLVVLCGRRAIDTTIPGEPQSLVSIFQECLTKGDFDDIVDPNLEAKFSSESLKEFIKSIENCLHHVSMKRPTMSQVVTNLECALEKMQSTAPVSGDSSQPCDDGIVTPSNKFGLSFVHQESGLSSAEEGTTSQVIQDPESETRRLVEFESTRKQAWFWPWGALWRKRKSLKKKDFPSGEDKITEMKQDLPLEEGLVTIPEVQEDVSSEDGLTTFSDVKEVLPSEGGLVYSFTISEIAKATENFSNGCLIKENESGRLFEGYFKRLGKQCAVFQLKRNVSDKKFVEFIDEFKMLLQLRHRNLVPIIGYCYNKPRMFVIYQYMGSNITLHRCLYNTSRVPLSWIDRIGICIGVAKGLQFIHNGTGETRIHGNLMPENILVQECLLPEGKTPLLWNFDLFRLSDQKIFTGGTEDYRPPELLLHEFQDKYDVYSFGLVLLEVLCRQKPFRDPHSVEYTVAVHMLFLRNRVEMGIKNRTLDRLIDSNLKGQIAPKCLCEFLKIALSCLRYNPSRRPTMVHIIEKLDLSLRLQQNAAVNVQDFNDVYELLGKVF